VPATASGSRSVEARRQIAVLPEELVVDMFAHQKRPLMVAGWEPVGRSRSSRKEERPPRPQNRRSSEFVNSGCCLDPRRRPRKLSPPSAGRTGRSKKTTGTMSGIVAVVPWSRNGRRALAERAQHDFQDDGDGMSVERCGQVDGVEGRASCRQIFLEGPLGAARPRARSPAFGRPPTFGQVRLLIARP